MDHFPWAISENAAETFNEFRRTFAAFWRKKNAASALFALRSVKRRNRLPALITFRNLRSVVIDTFVLQLGTH